MARGRVAGLLALLRFLKSRQSGIPLKLVLLAAVLYVVLPADLIPDVVPFAGWLDDLGLVALVGGWLASAYARSKKRTQESAPPDAARRDADPWAPSDR